jgi:hypothetical protein
MYRSHRTSPYCQRCWHVFNKQHQLDLHMTVTAAEICELKSGQPPEGITVEHERRLRCRKKTHPKQSDEETWRDMYKILFPDEEVPSPCEFHPLSKTSAMKAKQRKTLIPFKRVGLYRQTLMSWRIMKTTSGGGCLLLSDEILKRLSVERRNLLKQV